MRDESFHEIQLNGKQLVFLFMTATVFAVVVFLCGVMVGRGVRVPAAETTAATASEPAADPTASVQAPPSTSETTTTPSLAAQEGLTYPERLADPTLPAETLNDSSAATARPAAKQPPPQPRAQAAATPEPPGNGFVVQVAAVRERTQAETIARQLVSKGYPSFVTTTGPGGPQLFRVRVGKYKDRREAETIAGRLEKEEHFKPLITR